MDVEHEPSRSILAVDPVRIRFLRSKAQHATDKPRAPVLRRKFLAAVQLSFAHQFAHQKVSRNARRTDNGRRRAKTVRGERALLHPVVPYRSEQTVIAEDRQEVDAERPTNCAMRL